MNNDLISREALRKEFAKHTDSYGNLQVGWDYLIDNSPTVEVDKLILIVAKRHGKREMMLDALRPHGKWVRTALYGQTCLQCNQCGKADFDIKYDKYCPKCGAKMDKEEDNDNK